MMRTLRMLAVVVVACIGVRAQQAVAPPTPPEPPELPPRQVPLPVLYRAFFSHVEFLDKEAQKVQQSGGDPSELRDYYRDRLALVPPAADGLKLQAARTLAEIRRIDAEARAIIQGDRARFPGGQIPTGERLPVPPRELKELEREKLEATLQGIEELRATLEAESFEKIDGFIQGEFARNITRVAAPNPVPPARLSKGLAEAAQ